MYPMYAIYPIYAFYSAYSLYVIAEDCYAYIAFCHSALDAYASSALVGAVANRAPRNCR
jgi:hypothetical protein